ncbi:MAG: amidohydrolase family protein, partial [Pseudomonadota bacterium]
MKKLFLATAAIIGLPLIVGASHPSPTHTTLIHAGTLIAVPGEAPLTNRTIVVEDGKVARIVSGF